MTNRLELSWNLDGFVDEQRYYCSETPIDLENLPVPKAVLANDVRSYVDAAVEVGKTYYVAVSSVRNSTEKLSVVQTVETTSLNTILLMHFNNNFINEITGESAVLVGSVPFVDALFAKGVQFQQASEGQNLLALQNTDGRFNFPGKFTIEFYFKQTRVIGAYQNILLGGSQSNPGGVGIVSHYGNIQFSVMYGRDVLKSTRAITQNQEMRIALTRDENNIVRMFFDGILDSHVVASDNFTFVSTDYLRIGNHPNGTGGAGIIDELRIVKDQCLYKENYVLSDTEFTP